MSLENHSGAPTANGTNPHQQHHHQSTGTGVPAPSLGHMAHITPNSGGPSNVSTAATTVSNPNGTVNNQPSDYKVYQSNSVLHQSPNHSIPQLNAAPPNPVYSQLPQQYRYYNDQYQYYNQQQNYPYYMYNQQQNYPYNYYQGQQGQGQGQGQQGQPQPQPPQHQQQPGQNPQGQPLQHSGQQPPVGPPQAQPQALVPPQPQPQPQGQTNQPSGAGAGAGASAGAGAAAPSQNNSSDLNMNSNFTVGQYQPPGIRPRVTTTMWEDEKTLCYQVDANNVSVVRRADNNMINGTKLLNVAQMTRGRRDGILKLEKVRHVVKIGSMHLKGVWIPFERALAMAQREGIVDLLYPLFVRDIKRVIQTGITPSKTSAVPYYEQGQQNQQVPQGQVQAQATQSPAASTQHIHAQPQSQHQQQPVVAAGATGAAAPPQASVNQSVPPLPNPNDSNAGQQPMYGYQQYYPSQYYPYNGYAYNNQMYSQYQYPGKPRDDNKDDRRD